MFFFVSMCDHVFPIELFNVQTKERADLRGGKPGTFEGRFGRLL